MAATDSPSPSHPLPNKHDVDVQPGQQSGTIRITLPEPTVLTDETKNLPLPVTSPTYQHCVNKQKKAGTRNRYRRKPMTKEVQNLTSVINPIPFAPTIKLDVDRHQQVLKRLGLYNFSKVKFCRSFRTDLIVQLVVNYDPKRRCSYVNDLRVNVCRADLARALKLPYGRQDRGSGVEEVDSDSEVFSDENIGFIEDFVANWVVLGGGSSVMPTEIVNWTRCIRDGRLEKLDSASLIWYMVEKELSQGDKLVDCYYAAHFQHLMRMQRPVLFEDEKEEIEVELENISVVQEQNSKLNLGTDVEEIAQEEVTKDAEEGNEEMEEHVHLNNVLGDHFLKRCQSSNLNNFDEIKIQEVEDEQDKKVEHVVDIDEEEDGERMDEGFDMEVNDDSFYRDGLIVYFLQGIETSDNPCNSHVMSRDGSFMSHSGPSFYNNGCKRVMEPAEDMHQNDQNSQRLKTAELSGQAGGGADVGGAGPAHRPYEQRSVRPHLTVPAGFEERLVRVEAMVGTLLTQMQWVMDAIATQMTVAGMPCAPRPGTPAPAAKPSPLDSSPPSQ